MRAQDFVLLDCGGQCAFVAFPSHLAFLCSSSHFDISLPRCVAPSMQHE